MKGCILIAITLCFFGCSEEQLSLSSDSTVHLAGFVGASAGSPGATYPVASYWKDGAYTDLTHDSTYSNVTSMYINESSVLIGGSKGFPSSAVFWQDGKETLIDESHGGTLVASRNNNLFGVWLTRDASIRWVFFKNGTAQPIIDTAYNIGPTALALLGDDMYVSGCSVYQDWTAGSRSYHRAQCWKNGQLIFRESEISKALSIFIHQNDIYMAGYFENTTSPGSNACYWKNGQRVNLTGMNATAISIFVTDAHVYVSGVMDNRAVYWKDGELLVLTPPGPYSAANSIFVQGANVHVAGVEHGHPAYWKNDVKQNIANQDKPGEIKFVVVGSN